MKSLHMVAWILVVVGGINWGLEGVGMLTDNSLNLVNMLVGNWPMVEALVYLLVGVSAVYVLLTHKKDCRECSVGGGMM